RGGGGLVAGVLLRALIAAAPLAATATWSTPAALAAPAPDLMPPLERAPLDQPLRITATFGEYRAAHFHGGDDFSTGHTVGREVHAPLSGWIERARVSG